MLTLEFHFDGLSKEAMKKEEVMGSKEGNVLATALSRGKMRKIRRKLLPFQEKKTLVKKLSTSFEREIKSARK